jgi:hypothetical protein
MVGAVVVTGEQGTDSGQSKSVEKTAWFVGEGGPPGLSSVAVKRFLILVGLSRPGLRNRNVLLKNELEGVIGSLDEESVGEGGVEFGDGSVDVCPSFGSSILI